MKFLLRILVIAVVSYGLSRVLSGIHVSDFWTAVAFALVLALLNMFIKPILIVLTLPVTIVTLGLFLFVINAILVWLSSKFVSGFVIDGFWWALIFSLILSLVTSIINGEVERNRRPTN